MFVKLILYYLIYVNFLQKQQAQADELLSPNIPGYKYSHLNGVEYWYNYDKQQTFAEAYTKCKRRPFGGTLVSIKSKAVQDHLEENMPNLSCKNERVFYFIGLNDVKSEGNWEWLDGTRLGSFSFTNWRNISNYDDDCGNEPNGRTCWNGVKFMLRKDQDRVVISGCHHSYYGKWFDDPLTQKHFFICQRKIPVWKLTTTTTAATKKKTTTSETLTTTVPSQQVVTTASNDLTTADSGGKNVLATTSTMFSVETSTAIADDKATELMPTLADFTTIKLTTTVPSQQVVTTASNDLIRADSGGENVLETTSTMFSLETSTAIADDKATELMPTLADSTTIKLITTPGFTDNEFAGEDFVVNKTTVKSTTVPAEATTTATLVENINLDEDFDNFSVPNLTSILSESTPHVTSTTPIDILENKLHNENTSTDTTIQKFATISPTNTYIETADKTTVHPSSSLKMTLSETTTKPTNRIPAENLKTNKQSKVSATTTATNLNYTFQIETKSSDIITPLSSTFDTATYLALKENKSLDAIENVYLTTLAQQKSNDFTKTPDKDLKENEITGRKRETTTVTLSDMAGAVENLDNTFTNPDIDVTTIIPTNSNYPSSVNTVSQNQQEIDRKNIILTAYPTFAAVQTSKGSQIITNIPTKETNVLTSANKTENMSPYGATVGSINIPITSTSDVSQITTQSPRLISSIQTKNDIKTVETNIIFETTPFAKGFTSKVKVNVTKLSRITSEENLQDAATKRDSGQTLTEIAEETKLNIAEKLQNCFGNFVMDDSDVNCNFSPVGFNAVLGELPKPKTRAIDIWENDMSPFTAKTILENKISETLTIRSVDGIFVKISPLTQTHQKRVQASEVLTIDLDNTLSQDLVILDQTNISDSEEPKAVVTAILGDEAIAKGDLRNLPPFKTTEEYNVSYENEHVTKLLSQNTSVLSVSLFGYDVEEGDVWKQSIPVQIKFDIRNDLTAIEWNQKQNRKIKRGGIQRSCVFYDQENEEWSSRGCVKLLSTNNYVHCSCNHTTSFAVMVSMTTVEIPEKLNLAIFILETITTVFLTITLFLLLAFRKKLRKDRTFTQINLTASLICLHVFFILGTVAESTTASRFCEAMCVLSHYFLVASAVWMLNEGVVLYMKTCSRALNFNFDKLCKKLLLAGWALPGLYVTLCAGIGFGLGKYMDKSEIYLELEEKFAHSTEVLENQTINKYDNCWLSTDSMMILTAAIPVLLVLLINSFILIRIAIVVWKMNSQTEKMMKTNNKRRNSSVVSANTKATFKATVLLMPILGLPWILSFLVNIPGAEIIFVGIHGVLSGLHGEFLFFIYIFYSHDMRRALKLKAQKYRFTSSLFTSWSKSREGRRGSSTLRSSSSASRGTGQTNATYSSSTVSRV